MKFSRDLVPEIDAAPTRSRAAFPEIVDELFWRFYEIASPYSLVHVTGFYNVYQALRYTAANDLPGDLVECGCLFGGMAIFIGLLRRELGMSAKTIYLYDTFDGPPLGQVDMVSGIFFDSEQLPDFYETVRENIEATLETTAGYVMVRGRVEDTLAATPVDAISLLRLDTDFWSSTRAALEALYPRLVRGGTLIIDDYGMFDGARAATDAYLAKQARPPLLNRIDPTVFSCVKP